MCGITGFVGHFDASLLKKMNRTLTHRGPDEEGYFHRKDIGLAMRRLSIIDITSGHQPIPNEDQTVWTVFNGEIYNFLELRQELKKKGHRFRTDHSDTETIVHAYEEYGPEFVTRFNGMFAIALWDDRKKRLILYRDRLGEKPLYYWLQGKNLFFASEIKAILALPFFKKELNPEALFYYLSFKNSPRQHVFFEGVESLFPGQYAIFEKGRLVKKIYWEIDASKELKITEAEAADEIRALLKSSVRYRMISDVPLGAYLSGGVDSSAVVGYMSRIRKKPIETFSLTYKDDLPNKDSDRQAAALMSKRFSTRHREYQMSYEEFDQDLENILCAFDEPFGGTISTYFLSKLIRKHVKVAISGDGADELFGSYKAHRLAYPISQLNQFLKKGIDPYRLNAAQRHELFPFADKMDYLMKIRAPHPYQWHAHLSAFSDEEKRHLLGTRVAKQVSGLSLAGYYKKAYARTKTDDVLNQVLQVECQNLLPDQVLNFVDKLSMAHSVEVRPPFLDHRLVEFAFKLPGRMKINKDGITKHILKRAVSDVLPKQILERPKEGFILPYHFWMQRYMQAKIKTTLSVKNLKKHHYFDENQVQHLLEDYQSGGLEKANKIYLIFIFQLWWNRYFK